MTEKKLATLNESNKNSANLKETKESKNKIAALKEDKDSKNRFSTLKEKKYFTDILFLLIVFFIGITTSFSYGKYLDEQIEKGILYSNIYEYVLHVAPGSSLAADFAENEIIPIKDAVDRDHGVALYYPLFFIWEVEKSDMRTGSLIWHAYTFFLVFLGMVCLYFLIKDIFDDKFLAMASIGFFWLSPRIFAQSHYNNKDMVLLSAFLMIFYFGHRLSKKANWLNTVMFALCGAIAMNIKIVGAWPFGVMGIYALVRLIVNKKFDKKVLIKMFSCIALWAFFFVLLTPACFGGIVAFFLYLIKYALDYSRWNDFVLYNGIMLLHKVTGTPHKYLLRMIVITTPVGFLLMAALGFAGVGVKIITKIKDADERGRAAEIIVLSICGLVPMAFAVISGTHLYNGWRHFYFTYASLTVLMVYGLYFFRGFFKKKQMIPVIMACVYFLIVGVGIADNFTREHSYYNFLAGKNVEERFELDYWDVSIYEVEKYIVNNESGNVTVATLNNPTRWGIERNLELLTKEENRKIMLTDDYENADYLIINRTYAFMYSKDEFERIKHDFRSVKKIVSYGNTVCEVYKRNENTEELE
ncbi:MAG: glycosyltransferase family 39 protein [Lachnospiraceae bacterium]|nr:glycosyltransferase family 39 protein [Lachnospiraceae bacterium]